MLLRLTLSPTRASYCSGDFLTATLEISNEDGPADVFNGPLEVATVNVDFSGTERIDKSWVSSSYQPASVQYVREGKREVRQILRTPSARLIMQDTVLMPGESRRWLLRCWLPKTLPPSHRGVAVRYSYQLQATAQFALPKQLPNLPRIPLSSSAAVLADSLDRERGPFGSVVLPPTSGASSDGAGSWSRRGSSGNLALSGGSLPLPPSENAAAPSRYQTAEASTPVHLWPSWDPNERRGGVGTVAAGDDAEQMVVGYQLGYGPREVTIDFQELGREGDAAGGRGKGFAFQQLDGEGAQQWQPAFLTSIDHRPSVSAETPTLAPIAPPSNAAEPQPAAEDDAGDAATPLSELTLHGAGESEDTEGPQSALRSARSGVSTGRHMLMSPTTPGEAALRSYNLRVGDAALVRVALHAPSDGHVALGSVLSGTLDFRASQEAAALNPEAPRCIQVAVLLETEEVVSERWRSNSSGRQPSSSIRKVWGEHMEITADLVLTHFIFSLPADAPASFATHLVSLRWVLRFEFTTSVAKPASWLSGGPTPERIAWALPVLVRPPAVPRSW
ncbi:g3482 [Coccomyxa elongata]